MMEIKGNMMSVREDVRVLDATLRDGGLMNPEISVTKDLPVTSTR